MKHLLGEAAQNLHLCCGNKGDSRVPLFLQTYLLFVPAHINSLLAEPVGVLGRDKEGSPTS